ncbi:glycosyltransferase [Flavobacterium jejuense]|uniref:Glycosyltransferase n=1 Tax=Flavobacterium jejuense TaxID=1544455 RepID=A0ABX0IKR5_9FLAO|nr:glycosyltransferase family 2 protein [Flavobacterium jejuense]NHN24404.1 glycosyltransferase [Flavobacterium jejuense]
MKDIAVILINYNSIDYTINCVKSIQKKTCSGISFEIIIVDNDSKNNEFERLVEFSKNLDFKDIVIIKSNINLGFGGGNLLGVQHSNATYYAFVNNDSIFKNDCLFLLKKAMDNNPEYGICGPKAYKEDGTILPTLDYFASPIKELFGRSLLHRINPKKYIDRTKDYVDHQVGQFVSGSFMMVRAIDFWKVGGFDTNIFLYYEETDLCKRLLELGKKAYLIPEAEFIHYHGASTPKSILIKTELKISFLYVIRKHYGYFWHVFLLNKLRLQFLVKSIFKFKYWYIFKILIKGAHISDSLKQRQE